MKKKIIIEPNNISEWYALVREAEKHTGYHCDESVQNYLILTLDQYTTDASLANSVMAIDFLEGVNRVTIKSIDKLRRTGDRCLILSGLFPERANKSNVSVTYFIEIGQQSYYIVADQSTIKYDPKLFYKLSKEFKKLSDLLNAMRTLQPSLLQ